MNFNIKSIAEYNKRSEEILQQIYLHFYQHNSLEVDFDYDLKNFRQSDKDFVMFDICGKLNKNKAHKVQLTMNGNHYILKEIRDND